MESSFVDNRRDITPKAKTADLGKTTVRSYSLVEVRRVELLSERTSDQVTTSVSSIIIYSPKTLPKAGHILR